MLLKMLEERDLHTNWNEEVSHLDQTETYLGREHGTPKLIAYVDDANARGPVPLETFVQRCYPSQFLDMIEAFSAQLDRQNARHEFQANVNGILREEGVPWRMASGEIFRIDSDFLDVELVERTEELLRAKSYSGALDEFREARGDLTEGETREAIAKAHAAMESAMKTILGVSSGSASELIRKLTDRGFFDDLPEEFRAGFGAQVLMSLPTLGNRLGRHGQGANVVEVPRHYAELAVHLAAAFIRVLAERHEELQEATRQATAIPLASAASVNGEFEFGDADDDIPF